jgi:hypothetical protein
VTTAAEAARAVRRPWLPPELSAHGWGQSTVGAFRYAVVDELVDGDVGLTVTPWPWADGLGRLRFDLDAEVEVALTLDGLRRLLYEGLLQRAPRVGDVFALRLAPGTEPEGDAADWRGAERGALAEAYDISAEARKVSKLAYYARVAAVFDHGEAERLGLDDLADVVEPAQAREKRLLPRPVPPGGPDG